MPRWGPSFRRASAGIRTVHCSGSGTSITVEVVVPRDSAHCSVAGPGGGSIIKREGLPFVVFLRGRRASAVPVGAMAQCPAFFHCACPSTHS